MSEGLDIANYLDDTYFLDFNDLYGTTFHGDVEGGHIVIASKINNLDLSNVNCESITYKDQTGTDIANHFLPKNLRYLFISGDYGNSITELPNELPDSLEKIVINRNEITRLPIFLPKSLKYLNINDNNLEKLPDELPPFLYELDCGYNNLSRLPDKLPETLKYFYYYDNPFIFKDKSGNTIELSDKMNLNKYLVDKYGEYIKFI